MSFTTCTTRRLTVVTELAEAVRRLLDADDGEVNCYWNYTSPNDPLLDVLHDSGPRLWNRKGRVRFVYPTEALGEPAVAARISWQQNHGIQVGHSARLPPGAMLVTGHGALVTSRPDAGCNYAVVQNASALRALRALTALIQRSTEPVRAGDDEPLNAVERQLLDMLTMGMTDRAVARKLGLSERTVRRLMAQLMERLGAASRFEAGARAVERGWIE